MPKETTPAPQTHERTRKNEVERPSLQKKPVSDAKIPDTAAIVQHGEPDPTQLNPSEVLTLQRQVGNTAVNRLLKPASTGIPIQKKLTVGAADDPYEREADQVAEQVVGMQIAPSLAGGAVGGNGSKPVAQRQEDEDELQTKPLAAGITPLTLRRQMDEEEVQTRPLVQRSAPEEEEVQTKPLLQRSAPEEEEVQTKPLLQRSAPEEEEVQTKPLLQRAAPEEEEVQTKPLLQRSAPEEEEVQTKPLVQRAAPEEEEVQTKPLLQRSAPEEEEVQTKPLLQRAAPEEEEVQTKPLVQRAAPEEEEVQTKPVLQRAAPEEEEVQTKPLLQRAAPEEEEIQTSPVAVDPRGSFDAGTDVESRLQASRGSGNPLPDETRNFMEPRFGADFGGVRLHSDGEAADLNRAVHAQAFTHGQDIYLGQGKTDIASSSGKNLLAHELTHVVQQGGAEIKPAAESVQRFGGFIPTEQEILADTPSGFAFFGKTTYGLIMEEVGKYHKLGEDKYADQLKQIQKILGMIAVWESKHPGKLKGAELKRGEMIAGLKGNLELEKREVTEQATGNQTLTAGATTADPNTQSKYGIVGPAAKVYEESDATMTHDLHFPADEVVDFEDEDTSHAWMLFAHGNKKYWVSKAEVKWSTWENRTGLLFPEEPSAKDIEQGHLGDCYLLAAITSLVQSGSDKVTDMMHDNGATVTVRLFDIDTSATPYTYTPKNITVNKSVAMLDGKESFASGALWVQMLEKAYAAAGYTGDYPAQTGALSMGKIAGGYAWVAMGHLVGKEAIQVGIQPQSLSKTPGGAPPAMPAGIGKAEWEKIKKEVEAKFVDQFLFVENFEAFFASNDGKKYPFGVRQKILDWISESGLYQHEVGTGRYTKSQIAEFDAIVDALGKGKLVTLSSNKEIAEGSAGRGMSGGEAMKMGLAGGHEYTVLDYGYGDADNPLHAIAFSTKNAARWLKVRNPWGSYGRQYEWDATGRRWVPKKASSGNDQDTEAIHFQTKGGVFWLELGDMNRNFRRYQIG